MELGYTHRRATSRAARSAPAIRGPASRFRRRPRRPGTRHSGRAAAGHGHGRRRRRALPCRAITRTSCCARCADATSRSPTAWPNRWRSSSTETAEFRGRGRGVHRRAGLALRPGRRQARRRARRPHRAATRAGRRRGCGSFCLYGDTTGETDEFGLPVRYPWANDYRGRAMVLYGHTPVPDAGMGEQHPVPGHRVRVRRPAHGAALPGAELVVGAGRSRCITQPAKPFPRRNADAVRRRTGAPARPGRPRHHGRARHPRRRDQTPRPGQRPGGERRRRARGHEPLRARPALAALPAADDEPGGDLRP